MTGSGVDKRDERKRTADEVFESVGMTSKPGGSR
jgi:hypothetical protein